MPMPNTPDHAMNLKKVTKTNYRFFPSEFPHGFGNFFPCSIEHNYGFGFSCTNQGTPARS
jgi:hypothetical protein